MFKYAPVGRGGEFLADAFELISIAVKESSEYVDSLIEAEMMNATERKNR